MAVPLDLSWDGVNTWALRLSNHARGVGLYAKAAQWADSVRAGAITRYSAPAAYTADLDQDGESEYVLSNYRVFAVFERYGGRCVLACGWSAGRNDAEVVVAAPITNPSSPGEEELADVIANRCSAFKVMNGGTRADEACTVTRYVFTGVPEFPFIVPVGWQFTSPDGQLVRDVTLSGSDATLNALFYGTLGSPYLRTGLSPNPQDLMRYGQTHLAGSFPGAYSYQLVNSSGGYAALAWTGGESFNAAPSYESADRRNLALTEEVELSGPLPFSMTLTLGGDATAPPNVGVPPALVPAAFAITPPSPSPARGSARFRIALPAQCRCAGSSST